MSGRTPPGVAVGALGACIAATFGACTPFSAEESHDVQDGGAAGGDADTAIHFDGVASWAKASDSRAIDEVAVYATALSPAHLVVHLDVGLKKP